MGCVNIGPAYAQVWNSPRSPHGSIAAGSSSSSAASNSRPANARSSTRDRRTPAGRRSPAAHHVSSQDGRYRRRRCGKVGVKPEPASRSLAIAADVFEKEIAEGHVGKSLGTARPRPSRHGGFVCLVRARAGMATIHSGSPSAAGLGLEKFSPPGWMAKNAVRADWFMVVSERPDHRCQAFRRWRASHARCPCRSTTTRALGSVHVTQSPEFAIPITQLPN